MYNKNKGLGHYFAVVCCSASLVSTAGWAGSSSGWYYGGELGIQSLDDARNQTRSATTAGAGDCLIDLSALIPGVNALCDDPSITPGGPQSFTSHYDRGYYFGGVLGLALESGWRPELALTYRDNDFESLRLDSGYGAATGGTVRASGSTKAISLFANAWYDFAPVSEKWRPYAGLGLGGARTQFDEFRAGSATVDDKDLVWAAQLGAGLGYQLDPLTVLSADLRLFTTGDSIFQASPAAVESEYRGKSLGLSLRHIFKPLREPDSDGDGVPDSADECPDSPAGSRVNAKGCPLDSDGDGVPDEQDKCPGTAAGAKVDAEGCEADTDGDGVKDSADQCPDTPQGATVSLTGCTLGSGDKDGDGVDDSADQCPDTPPNTRVDARGCPVDSDGDGVLDDKDQCPGTPAGSTVNGTGCVMSADGDADGDGVADGSDQCPGTLAGAKVMSNGCAINQSAVLSGVNFALDSDQLTERSDKVLDAIVAVLKESAGFKVEIAGHTCDLGGDVYNLDLSRRRAEAVRAYLVQAGIAADRLTAAGYGETQPAVPNDTADNRDINRRVELKVVSDN